MDPKVKRSIDTQRSSLARRLERILDRPLALLGFVWLVLVIVELARGLSPFLTGLGMVIWAIFLLDFLLRFALAPAKRNYLRRNWLNMLSLAVPALRLVRALRVLRAARAIRGLRLLRLVTSLNRGMRALAQSMRRRGFGYVMLLTVLVLAGGAAGIYAFERGLVPGRSPDDYGTALWWTAMILTTMGSEYWPQTAEGRLLCLLLAVYGFTMFGYVTATLATFFVARDTARGQAGDSTALLRAEIARLRDELRRVGESRKPA